MLPQIQTVYGEWWYSAKNVLLVHCGNPDAPGLQPLLKMKSRQSIDKIQSAHIMHLLESNIQLLINKAVLEHP